MDEFLPACQAVEKICASNWGDLTKDELIDVAWAYYFFSIQFRENLRVARALYPDDIKLAELEKEECITSNLSPWPGVALQGEHMDHDEFMRRTLLLEQRDGARVSLLRGQGERYLAAVRATDAVTRANSMSSYEGGGLERVFRSILTAPDWDSPVLGAFRHFLLRHLELDEHHGLLVDHLSERPDTEVLWALFQELLTKSVPALSSDAKGADPRISAAVGARADTVNGRIDRAAALQT